MSDTPPHAKKKPKRPKRPAPVLPRGFQDVDGADARAIAGMLNKVSAVYEAYGFDRIETPFFEYTEALGKFLPDQDRPNEGVFSLQDDDEAWLSLRYDLTAPLARYVAAHYDALPKPFRSYRSGYVFRNEKPGPGRFRQFMQMDADTVGAPGPAADAEMCMMMADVMEALGIPRGHYVVRVNSRKVLDGIMDAAGIRPDKRLAVLRAIDKLDRLGPVAVRSLLGDGRKDDSGDYTSGAGLSVDQIDLVLTSIAFSPERGWDFIEGGEGGVPRWRVFASEDQTQVAAEHNDAFADYLLSKYGDAGQQLVDGVRELSKISKLVSTAGYDPDRIQIDPSVVRGLEYYTGPVFEVELLMDTVNEKGEPARFGSVGGGGRYDGLVGRFMAQDVPATGFSIGVSRLAAALKALGKLDDTPRPGPVVVTVMDRTAMADYQAMATELRKDGIRAEVFLGNPKQFGKQLAYADKRGSPVAIIQGSDEREAGTIQVKDLILGAEEADAITDNREWRESRAAQVTVERDKLVETVRAMLARHRLLDADDA